MLINIIPSQPPPSPSQATQRGVARRPLRVDDRRLLRLAVRQEEQRQGAVAAADVHHLGGGTGGRGDGEVSTHKKLQKWRSNQEKWWQNEHK